MAFFDLRALLKVVAQLERIANCLEFLVRQEAIKSNVMWSSGKRVGDDGEEPELFHTNPAEINKMRQDEQEKFAARGEGSD